jgi:hypothetical protein
MLRFLSKLARKFQTANTRRSTRRTPRRTILQVEGLEDRLVPAVVFNSPFGGDTIFWVPGNSANAPANEKVTAAINYNPSVLNSTTVYLDFWGSSWTPANAGLLASDAQTIIQSKFFSQLSVYGFHGTISYGGYTIDNTNIAGNNTGGDPTNPQTRIQMTTQEIDLLLNNKLPINVTLPTSSCRTRPSISSSMTTARRVTTPLSITPVP